MAPTADEELKLRLYTGDMSLLGPADRFLKILIEIPFAFKRMESLLFMSILHEEVSYIKESFATLEVSPLFPFIYIFVRLSLFLFCEPYTGT